MIKFIGAGLVVLASTLFGFAVARKFTCRVMQLRELQLAIQLLQTEIVYAATPLPIAFERISHKQNTIIKEIFAKAANFMQSRKGYTASDALEKATMEVFADTALKKEDREIILDLGKSLGISDREDQRKYLAFALEQLQKAEANAAEERRRNEKIWRYLGFLGGMAVVILIY